MRKKKSKGKAKGPESSTDASKYKSMAEVVGIGDLQFGKMELNEVTPRGFKGDLQAFSEKKEFSQWLNAVKSSIKPVSTTSSMSSGSDWEQSNVIPAPVNLEESIHVDPESATKSEFWKPKVKITMDDIQEEVQFWDSSIVCFVLGANPPTNVIDGFVRRIWGKLGVDKVAGLGNGIHIVRFNAIENRDKVLAMGVQFFDKKPFIVKPWEQHMNMNKNDIKTVPIWIQLPELELDFTYWGEKSLNKIVSLIGKLVKVDQATKMRDKLFYARVLVGVSLTQEFPEYIEFEDVHGEIVQQKVNYEWKPSICGICKGLGHGTEHCTRKSKQVWEEKHPRKEVDKREDAGGQRKMVQGKDNQKGVNKDTENNKFRVLNEEAGNGIHIDLDRNGGNNSEGFNNRNVDKGVTSPDQHG